MAMRNHMQPNSTAYTAGIPHNEDNPLTPAERENKREQKRGKWSDKDKEHLIKLTRYRQRIDIESIPRQIGREPGAVRYRLRLMAKEKSAELGNDAGSFSVAFLGRDLGKEEQSVLEARMCQIIDELLEERDTTTQWRAILSAKSTEAWVATILPFIPTRVKHILAAPARPQLQIGGAWLGKIRACSGSMRGFSSVAGAPA